MIVVDADVIAYFWLQLDSNRTEHARRVRLIDPEWVAPNLWHSEFRSILRGYLNAGLLGFDEALLLAEKAERDMEGRSYDVFTADVLKLVADTGHSAYDCEYVALTHALQIRLVSGDRKLVKQFPDVAVLLEQFANDE